jgi:hypothetical protein
MASQESPLRVNSTLLGQAQAASAAFNRSVPEQITHWAEIGRLVEAKLNPEQISFLKSGLVSFTLTQAAQMETLPKHTTTVDIIDIARKSQCARETPLARQAIENQSSVRYQASVTHPGFLDQINACGEVTVGQFKDGKFKKVKVN